MLWLWSGALLAAPIVNGQVEDGYASVVALGIVWGDEPMVMCSGNLITPRVVLSAAHCSADLPMETVVSVGKAFFGTQATDLMMAFEDGTIHPDYEPLTGWANTGRYDLAVLSLESDAPYEPTRVRMEPLGADDEGTWVTAVGYGTTSADSDVTGEKHSVELQIATVSDMHITGTTDTSQGQGNICSGDSGGPMFVQAFSNPEDTVGRPEQWAVHSYGDSNCQSAWGSTRADVDAEWLLDFIEQTHGTDDLCEINGWYGDGLCDDWCDAVDPDCEAAIDDEQPRGCACSSTPVRGVGWWLLVPLGLVGGRRRTSR